MAIIIDIKNAIRDKIFAVDNSINFNFNEIETADYPFIFFYIPSYRIDKAIDSDFWRKVNLMCVLEYAKSEDNNQTELWTYADTMTEFIKSFTFKDTKLNGRNPEFKTVDGVLQLTFDIEFYIKAEDTGELMQELEFSLNENSLDLTEIMQEIE